MAINERFSALKVFPEDYEALEEDTRYQLSDVDQVIPGCFTIPCLIFPIGETADKNRIIENLQTGLRNTLTCIPLLGGKLHNNPDTNRVEVIRKNHEPIVLGVHHLDQQGDTFPTYEALAASGFPSAFFSSNTVNLTPPGSSVNGFRRDDECPVAVFQANFIHGGLILTLALHHMCGDAKSMDHVFSLWASSTKAAMSVQQLPSFKPVFDRGYFNAHFIPDATEVETLKRGVKGFIYLEDDGVDSEVTNEPPARSETVIQLYHFSVEACHRLKTICSPKEREKYVSTYDCIAAATWRAMTRARLPYLGMEDMSARTRYTHPVDTRQRFSFSSVEDEYFGNAFIIAVTEPVDIGYLLSSNGLAAAALAVRKSILDLTGTSMSDLIHLQRGITGKQKMVWEWRRENVMGTSWTAMRLSKAYNFGLGFPRALRILVPPFEGVCGLLPAAGKDGQSDGYDVYVVMEKGCSERMMRDEEYLTYCNLCG